jgi:catechol 2,3-dioxygenase-like lactoylglutathione lyase family enzyme
MLSKLEIHTTIPAKDIERAKRFYSEKVGFPPPEETPGGLMYRCKNSWFLVFASQGASNGQFTQAGWATDQIENEVQELRARGVVFEEYDFPGLKTVNGIATTGPNRAAWFKDSEGNLLGIVQMGNPV